MLKSTFLLFTLLLSFAAWSQSTQPEWKLLAKESYSIRYPANWDLDQTGYEGTTFLIASELTSPQDLFRENVTLIIHDLRGTTIYLDKLVKQSERKFQETLIGFNLIESKRYKGKPEFHKIVFTGDKGNLKIKFEQYLWIKGIKAYVLTFAAEQDQYDNYKLVGQKITNSFKIK